MQGYESSQAHRSNQSLSLQTGSGGQGISIPRQARRMTVGSQSSLNLPDGAIPSPRPPSPLRNSFTMSSSTGIDPHEVASDSDDDDDEVPRRPRNWHRSASPASSVSNLAASFVQRVNNFVGGIAPPKSPNMPSDAELEAEAERERERSRREAEAILTREAQQRKHVEERVLGLMDNARGLPPPPSRSNTTPSPSSSHKEGGNWWQAAKNRLTPTKDKDSNAPITPAQQVILDAKAKDNAPSANLNIPVQPPTRKPVPASPSSPTPSRPLSTPNLSPSPMRQAESLAGSPSREAPPVYVQFTPQGTVDVPVTLLAIAKRFEKLEKWTIGHVRALEDRMNDVERWLVDKENLKEESSSKGNAQQELSEIREEMSELQGRVGELGREMAKLATAPSNLSSGPKAQVAAISSAHPRQASTSAQVQDTPSPTAIEPSIAEVFNTPRHTRISSSARESTSPPLAGGSRRNSAGTRLPYPTGDYNSPPDAFSPTGSPNASINSAMRGKISGLPQVSSGSPISSVFNLASTLTARPLSPPASKKEPAPTSGSGATFLTHSNSRDTSRTSSPLSSAKTPNSSAGLPPPKTSSRQGSVSPTPRKRYTVALGGPIVAPPSPPDQLQSNANNTNDNPSARRGAPGTPRRAHRTLFSEPESDGENRVEEDEDEEDEELGGETIGKSAAARYTRKLTVQKKRSNASMSSVTSMSSVDQDVLRGAAPASSVRRVGGDFRDSSRVVQQQQQTAPVPMQNARRMKAQSVYGMSSFLPSSSPSPSPSTTQGATHLLNARTSNTALNSAYDAGVLGTSPNTTAPLRFRSKSSEKLSTGGGSSGTSSPTTANNNLNSSSSSPFGSSTPNSAKFVDPLLLRRKQEVAAATQDITSSVALGGSGVPKPGARKMAVGQLVAFFDKDKDKKGRK